MWFLFRHNARQAKSAGRTSSSARPRLEALEDRCLLSAGSLDPTFGNGAGYVTTSTSPYHDEARTVLIQSNGDIVAVGNSGVGIQSGLVNYEFGVERYNPDGSLDSSFGVGGSGIALASFGSQSVNGTSGALYPVAGTTGDIVEEGVSSNGQQVLARFTPNGILDNTFGTGGEVMTAIPGVSSISSGLNDHVVVTSTGQIVALTNSTNTDQFVLTRYNADGTLDTTFGQGGFVITAVPNDDTDFGTLLQQPDGSLIVTQTSDANGRNTEGLWDLYCFNANGTPNTAFGNGAGYVTTAVPEYGYTETAALYLNAGPSNDGQIVVVGESGETEYLARYNANGSLDNTFGTGGLVQSPFSFVPWQAAVDANGRIVVAGTGGPAGGAAVAELARFNLNGTPDTTFGNGGLVTTTVAGDADSHGKAVAIYPNAGAATDGDIVVAGNAGNGTTSGTTKGNVLVARYLGQATSPYFQITGPSSVTAGTAGTYTISVFNPDGSADTNYSGTVQISSSDPKAVLPRSFPIDGDTATFSATLETAGIQSLIATDTATPGISGSDASITITPAAASQFVLSAPSSVSKGSKFSLTLTVEDAFGNVVTGYVGTVHFSSSDGTATLPANYTFTAADAGVHTFTNKFILRKRGTQSLSVTDTQNSGLTATDSINVT
jgi:uncharacterized delta-60 repeat protein